MENLTNQISNKINLIQVVDRLIVMCVIVLLILCGVKYQRMTTVPESVPIELVATVSETAVSVEETGSSSVNMVVYALAFFAGSLLFWLVVVPILDKRDLANN